MDFPFPESMLAQILHSSRFADAADVVVMIESEPGLLEGTGDGILSSPSCVIWADI